MDSGDLMSLATVVSGTPVAAQSSSREDNPRTLEQRAVTAAIWGMPIVSVYAMRQAYFRDASGRGSRQGR